MGADYTRTFRALSRWDTGDEGSGTALRDELAGTSGLDGWLARYRERLAREPRGTAARHAAMLAVNPKYVLRNWVAQEAIQNAETRHVGLVDEIRRVLDDPFAEHPAMERFAASPPDWARDIVVSCSS